MHRSPRLTQSPEERKDTIVRNNAAGRARVHTIIRLSQTQFITTIAEMSDGSCWSQTAEVIVTIGGCLDPL